MNYLKNYNDYVSFVKNEMALGNRPKDKHDYNKNFKGKSYFEFHHVVPKCLGGDNSKSNLIALTAREHFLAHYLLMKIYPDNYKLGIAFASFAMNANDFGKAVIYFNSRLYELSRKNIDFGATSRGTKRSKAFCENVSKALKGRVFTEEHKKAISKFHAECSGEKNSMYGKHHTEESKRKMSVNQKKAFTPERRKELSDWAKVRMLGNQNPRAKKVKCIENGMVFDTIKEAAIWVHGSVKSKSAISQCCKGVRNIALGYHWEYVEEDNNVTT